MSNERTATPAMASTETSTVVELDRLMSRYADGDTSAFGDLYRLTARRLHSYLLRLCGSERLADDLFQETFLRVHRSRGSFAAGAAALPWLYAIARNVYIDHRRRGLKERGTSVEDLAESEIPRAQGGANTDEAFAARRSLAIVRDTLQTLPTAQREAFVLLRFEGLTVADAAEILDTSPTNVKVRAFRAHEAIRRALREEAESE